MATGVPVHTFQGGDEANKYAESRGLHVQEIPRLKWIRVSADSYDLKLLDVSSVDGTKLNALYKRFLVAKWADSNLGVNKYLREELKAWIDEPSSVLDSRAYVTLSNWFLSID